MERKSLYVTVTEKCEDFASQTFWKGSEWSFEHDEWYDDGTGVLAYTWSGENQARVERAINSNPHAISYQIL